MLLDQYFGRREQRDLMPVADRDHRRDQRHDRLSAADIALQEPVHRSLRLKIVRDFLQHALLRARQTKWQDFLHFGAQRVVDPNLAILFLHFLRCAADAQRELEREELLEDDPPMGRGAAKEKFVVELWRSMQLLERRRERADV